MLSPLSPKNKIGSYWNIHLTRHPGEETIKQNRGQALGQAAQGGGGLPIPGGV